MLRHAVAVTWVVLAVIAASLALEYSLSAGGAFTLMLPVLFFALIAALFLGSSCIGWVLGLTERRKSAALVILKAETEPTSTSNLGRVSPQLVFTDFLRSPVHELGSQVLTSIFTIEGKPAIELDYGRNRGDRIRVPA